MSKTYTDREVYLIVLGACNNFCAYAEHKKHQSSVTEFAKWILEDKLTPGDMCERELFYGEKIEKNLENNGTLFNQTTT